MTNKLRELEEQEDALLLTITAENENLVNITGMGHKEFVEALFRVVGDIVKLKEQK